MSKSPSLPNLEYLKYIEPHLATKILEFIYRDLSEDKKEELTALAEVEQEGLEENDQNGLTISDTDSLLRDAEENAVLKGLAEALESGDLSESNVSNESDDSIKSITEETPKNTDSEDFGAIQTDTPSITSEPPLPSDADVISGKESSGV